MSTENLDFFEENLRTAIREELDRNKLSFADAARMMGEKDSLGLRDICNGRKRATADFVARLVGFLGFDRLLDVIHDSYSADDAQRKTKGAGSGYTARLLTRSEHESLLLVLYRALPAEAQSGLIAVLSFAHQKAGVTDTTPALQALI